MENIKEKLEIDFLKSKTYTEINEMFNQLKTKLDDTEKYLETKTLGILTKCTRVEVIDEKGRSYINHNSKNKVKIAIQDNDRTLKVFISNY